jgi:hypothetical protein
MFLNAGVGEGFGYNGDGGSIELKAGKSLHANGGHLVLESGSSEDATSGSICKFGDTHLLHIVEHSIYSSDTIG